MKINNLNSNKILFCASKNSSNNNIENKENKEHETNNIPIMAALIGLASLGIFAAGKKTRIDEIEFIKNAQGDKIAHKAGKVFSGVINIDGSSKNTVLTFKDGRIVKSVQKAKDGKFICGKSYKILKDGTRVSEKYFENTGKPVTVTTIRDKSKCSIVKDDYKGNNPVLELMHWEKQDNGDLKVVRLFDSDSNQKVNIKKLALKDDGYALISEKNSDYRPKFYKFSNSLAYKNVPVAVLNND